MRGIDSLESFAAKRKKKQTRYYLIYLNRFLTDLLSEISVMLNPYLIDWREASLV